MAVTVFKNYTVIFKIPENADKVIVPDTEVWQKKAQACLSALGLAMPFEVNSDRVPFRVPLSEFVDGDPSASKALAVVVCPNQLKRTREIVAIEREETAMLSSQDRAGIKTQTCLVFSLGKEFKVT